MEDFKNFKLELDFADENGKRSIKTQTVKVNTPKLKDKSTSYFNKSKSVYLLSFSLSLPEHIHSYLLGKEVNFRQKDYRRVYPMDMSKTISSSSIEELTNKWCEIVENYIHLKELEKSDLKKVIFYKFETNEGKYISSWNGLEFGTKSNIQYKVVIGYVSQNANGNVTRCNDKKVVVSESYDRELYSFDYVDWSEEREAFFFNIQNSFLSIIEKIKTFSDNINNENLDVYVVNNNLLKM